MITVVHQLIYINSWTKNKRPPCLPAATALTPPRRSLMDFTTALPWVPEYSGIPEVPSGSKTTYSSPPLEISLASTAGSSYPVGNLLEHKGEATHTIPGECERLFCDKLSAIFRGERRLFRQESLGIDASHHRSNGTGLDNGRIQRWIEVMDYTSDTIYRGFVTTSGGERTLFVFFEETALGHGLKSGLIALFELGSIPAFDCSQIVACVPRTQDGIEIEFTRNLGWCGFGLTTLKPWDTKCCLGDNPISTKWLFLSSEV